MSGVISTKDILVKVSKGISIMALGAFLITEFDGVFDAIGTISIIVGYNYKIELDKEIK